MSTCSKLNFRFVCRKLHKYTKSCKNNGRNKITCTFAFSYIFLNLIYFYIFFRFLIIFIDEIGLSANLQKCNQNKGHCMTRPKTDIFKKNLLSAYSVL